MNRPLLGYVRHGIVAKITNREFRCVSRRLRRVHSSVHMWNSDAMRPESIPLCQASDHGECGWGFVSAMPG
jgi:hypothetical protein